MKTKSIRKLISGLSFASALFIFQACYGTPQDLGMDVFIEGQVKSVTNEPVEGIKVTIGDEMQYQFTDEEGKFSLYTGVADQYQITFQDIDSTQNGSFQNKDTLLTQIDEKVYLDIVLEEK